jgi:hypothetical protein
MIRTTDAAGYQNLFSECKRRIGGTLLIAPTSCDQEVFGALRCSNQSLRRGANRFATSQPVSARHEPGEVTIDDGAIINDAGKYNVNRRTLSLTNGNNQRQRPRMPPLARSLPAYAR